MRLEEIYPKFSSPDKGGDKGTQHSYIEIYSEHIGPNTDSLLEIGVYKGQSIAMWSEYLPHATVIGLDIDIPRISYDVDVRKADATDPVAVERALGDMTFEVIIDDGSHRLTDQVNSFHLLWDRVKQGGSYFIEDIAGPDALRVLLKEIERTTHSYQLWDLRALKNRFDDILVKVTK